jgi:hypothetical protein
VKAIAAPASNAAAATISQPTYGISARSASDILELPTNVEEVYVPKVLSENTLNLLIVAKTPSAKRLVKIAIFSTLRPTFKR